MNTSKQPEEDETVLTDENATKSTPPPTPPGNSSLFFWIFQQEFLENQEKSFFLQPISQHSGRVMVFFELNIGIFFNK